MPARRMLLREAWRGSHVDHHVGRASALTLLPPDRRAGQRQPARAGVIGPAKHGNDVEKLCALAFSAPLPPTRSAPARASPGTR